MSTLYQNKLLYPEILWERPVHQYKASAGKILVVAGSRGEQGTALLTCEAIFRCGTGILTLAFPEELKGIYTGILPEAMTLALPQTHSGSIARNAADIIVEQFKAVDMVLIGPGLSTNTETVQLIWELLPHIEKPLVIDGDGLAALAYGIDAIRSKEGIEKVQDYFSSLKSRLIVTATPGAAAHILKALGVEKSKCKSSYVENHKQESAQMITEFLGAIVIISGPDAIIASKGIVVINKLNIQDADTEKSDEVLSGIVASFVAQNPNQKFKAICTAVYLHSMAQAIAQKEIGKNDITPNDVIRSLPQAIKKAENG